MAQKDSIIKPALGIYPIEAVCDIISDDLPFKVKKFNVSDEIAFIEEQAKLGKVSAIGECGLDGYWVPPGNLHSSRDGLRTTHRLS